MKGHSLSREESKRGDVQNTNPNEDEVTLKDENHNTIEQIIETL